MRLLLALVGLLVLPAAAPAQAPDGYSFEHGWFEAHDGVQLHAGVFLPERLRNQKVPAILVMTPYAAPNGGITGGGRLSQPRPNYGLLFEDGNLEERGYAYVQIDVRGFGGSGGCFEYYGPNEAKDVKTAVDWIASQPWADGNVGMWGISYDGAQQVLALASRPGNLKAAVIQSPGLSAYTALWHNRNHYALGRYVTTGAYTADDLFPPQNPSTAGEPGYATGYFEGLTSPPSCRSDSTVGMNTERDRDAPFWRGREPYLGAKGSEIPVLWSHGFQDANTKPVHLDVWASLRGPRSAWFGHYTHVQASRSGREGFLDEAMRFLDRHVRGVSAPETDPPVTVEEGSFEGSKWRAEASWPPADATGWKLPIRAGSYTDAPGNTSDGADAGAGHWTVTRPLAHAAILAGEAVLTVDVTTAVADTNLIAFLYDIDRGGKARLVNRGGATLKNAGAQKASYALYPSDWRFQAGHRIGVLLSGSDDDWFTPSATNAEVQVTGGTMELPLLRYIRDAFLEGSDSNGMTDDEPFEVPAAALQAEVDAAPPAQVPRPAAPCACPAPAAKGRLRLRIKGARLLVSGRMPGERRARLEVRFGGVRVARRSVRLRDGRLRATFPVRRLRTGRIHVLARGATMRLRASVLKKARRRAR